MNNQKLTRVVLSSHTKFTTESSSVSREDLHSAALWARHALDADMEYEISQDNVPSFKIGKAIYRAIVVIDWGALNVTIYNNELSKPLLTFVVTDSEQYDISKWETMVAEHGNVGNFSKPALPWCATVFHPGFDEDTGTIADWSSKFENDIAWAWLQGLIMNTDKFAKYAN